MAKLTPSLQQQIGEEVPAAGDVLGDPQLQVGGEPKMSSKIHGKLPKKIRKKVYSSTHLCCNYLVGMFPSTLTLHG
jgi:hypothetical protein